MLKGEFALASQQVSVRKLELSLAFGKHALSSCTILGCFGIMLWGLQPLIVGQSPDHINALARVIEAFHMGSLYGYCWGGVMTALYTLERRGKKRITKEKSEIQAELERHDSYRSSSGLTSSGDTPKRK